MLLLGGVGVGKKQEEDSHLVEGVDGDTVIWALCLERR